MAVCGFHEAPIMVTPIRSLRRHLRHRFHEASIMVTPIPATVQPIPIALIMPMLVLHQSLVQEEFVTGVALSVVRLDVICVCRILPDERL